MKLTSIKFPLLILVLPITLGRVIAASLLSLLSPSLSSLTSLLGLLLCGLNPLLNFLPVMFPSVDFPLLDYINDDGIMVEPKWYCPIIPMVLVNGMIGIRTEEEQTER